LNINGLNWFLQILYVRPLFDLGGFAKGVSVEFQKETILETRVSFDFFTNLSHCLCQEQWADSSGLMDQYCPSEEGVELGKIELHKDEEGASQFSAPLKSALVGCSFFFTPNLIVFHF